MAGPSTGVHTMSELRERDVTSARSTSHDQPCASPNAQPREARTGDSVDHRASKRSAQRSAGAFFRPGDDSKDRDFDPDAPEGSESASSARLVDRTARPSRPQPAALAAANAQKRRRPAVKIASSAASTDDDLSLGGSSTRTGDQIAQVGLQLVACELQRAFG